MSANKRKATRKPVASKRWTGRRWHLVLAFWLVCAGVLVVRAVDLQVVEHDFLAHQGDIRNLRVEPLAANRGVIRDRNGRPLAVSTPVVTLWANPQEAMENQQQWSKLTGNPIIDRARFARRVKAHASREFIYLARGLAPEQAESVLSLGVPGIYSLTEYRRYYPAGEVTSHVVGFTNIDEQGQEGVELAFDKQLTGAPGRKKVVRDLLGRVIQDIELIEPARPGEDVTLSLDLRLQYLAYKELMSAVHRFGATGGSVVVLDVKTGEVLAMVNQPGYNPNNRSGINTASLRNRAVTDLFEPGSTVKPFTVAAALEQGMVTPATAINTHPGYLRVGPKTIRDHRDYGVIDVTTVLTKSSNVGTSKLALSMDQQVLPAMLERFGFGQPTGVRFPGESGGVLPIRAKWRDVERAALSYGYGVSVTALQLAQAYAILGNQGRRVPLSMVKVDEAPQGERVIGTDTARAIVDMLETVVGQLGTARRARIPGYQVAGKTGTVHKLTATGYAEHRYQGIFAGLAPATDPRIAAVVVIDDPDQSAYYGGLVAAPVFSTIVGGALRAMHVPPDKPEGVIAGEPDGEGRT
ncbi:peptidoglycan D,D-transpeptidase FtsI family protein [Alloalcanivorax xenomutans]|jgi:cell division protein FtsI (penicillin-binding protein 3)|uniref:peptidoglycan D,D-transpeptidase FtsI family protein n=1 Tax=Alloalcanivorax xenomutans TaxID=1094342 RepID=UPI0003B87728|nr:penicillin-binding transpeptidase domain-containing protein [Alloalcanivorax xenomutans]ERS13779.1 cell division protein [Alcanivorax sp. PN-3]KYZ84318.1 cell division protein [Alcanivorax sp. KX64203]ARB46812.1 cell division protein [Alloalcanivorax xenomutans]MCE7522730.1 penicillin-binding protein 2 [Alloalcanivorax xenomutans]WOA30558.1 penicillin-binding transpeptidase domain-containing protein [Alloalcanivorax xenomutans]